MVGRHEWEQGWGQGKRLGLGNGLSHPRHRERPTRKTDPPPHTHTQIPVGHSPASLLNYGQDGREHPVELLTMQIR